MKEKHIGYWVATALFCVVYFGSGTADLLHASRVEATLAHLGYPAYLGNILGPLKLAAVFALLAPRFERVKEWAYAGIVFDLTGAFASHASRGDAVAPWLVTPIVLLGLVATSYLLRPASRRLASPSEQADHDRVVATRAA